MAPPDFVSAQSFHFVVRAVKSGSGKPFPTKMLLTQWKNAPAQLQALRHAACAAPDAVSFASAGTLFAPVEGSLRAWGTANQVRSCFDERILSCGLATLSLCYT